MRFFVENEVFEKLDNVCFGVVVARGIDNVTNKSEIKDMLESNISSICEQIANQNVKEHPRIVPYRDAFIKLGFNPNKFAPSVEALITRIAKKGQLPVINNVVDLANAVSIKHILPIGAHDIDLLKDQITVRLSVAGDSFSPFGVSEPEALEPGELVYASGNNIKTRRWIWRQSDEGKITENSTNIFFPIDGFVDVNCASVTGARDELGQLLKKLFNCTVSIGFIDRDNQSMSLD